MKTLITYLGMPFILAFMLGGMYLRLPAELVFIATLGLIAAWIYLSFKEWK